MASWKNQKPDEMAKWQNSKLTKRTGAEKKQKHETCPSLARISLIQAPTEVERGSGFDLLAPFGRFQRWTR
jgi:hypothetical protein